MVIEFEILYKIIYIFIIGYKEKRAKPMHEWEKFKVGTPSEYENGYEQDCYCFDVVGHVCHIDQAINILKEGKIRSGLVYDKSRLNKSRISVTWISPNNWWKYGFRYGNISFQFDWKYLIRGKKYYWVESIRHPEHVACRILITNQTHDNLPPYDPETEKPTGPWWYDKENDKHYFNSDKICVEFMFEEDLSLSNLNEIKFVKHHSDYCSINRNNPSSCKESGMEADTASALFFANILGQSIKADKKWFKSKSEENSNEYIEDRDKYQNWEKFFFQFICDLQNWERNNPIQKYGNVCLRHKESILLSRAICNEYSLKSDKDCITLMSLFKSKKECYNSLIELICIFFEFNGPEKLFIKAIFESNIQTLPEFNIKK